MKKLFILCVFLTACHSLSSSKNPQGAQQAQKALFQKALSLKERGYYKEALSQFRKFKSRFLYSRELSKKADLAIADIYFAKAEWEKAHRAFESFFELNPRHKKSDYALFYAALSYFKRLPTTEDRDLSLTDKTLFHIHRHLKLFPKSPFKSQLLELKQKVLHLLAQKEWMIARFHLRQEKPHSARPYLLSLLKNYSFLLPKESEAVKSPPAAKVLPQKTPLEYFPEDIILPVKSAPNLPSLKKLKKMIQNLKTGK